MVVSLPLNAAIARYQKKLQVRQMKIKDKRTRLMVSRTFLFTPPPNTKLTRLDSFTTLRPFLPLLSERDPQQHQVDQALRLGEGFLGEGR